MHNNEYGFLIKDARVTRLPIYRQRLCRKTTLGLCQRSTYKASDCSARLLHSHLQTEVMNAVCGSQVQYAHFVVSHNHNFYDNRDSPKSRIAQSEGHHESKQKEEENKCIAWREISTQPKHSGHSNQRPLAWATSVTRQRLWSRHML